MASTMPNSLLINDLRRFLGGKAILALPLHPNESRTGLKTV
jgi:hypothetical protein